MFVHWRFGPKLEALLGEARNFRTLVKKGYGDHAFEGYTFARPIFPLFLPYILPVWCNASSFNFPLLYSSILTHLPSHKPKYHKSRRPYWLCTDISFQMFYSVVCLRSLTNKVLAFTSFSALHHQKCEHFFLRICVYFIKEILIS